MAADYSYYIVLVNIIRNYRLDDTSLSELFTNPQMQKNVELYLEERDRKLNQLAAELTNSDIFKKLRNYIETKAYNNLNNIAKALHKLKNINESHSQSFFESLTLYLMRGKAADLFTKLTEIGILLRDENVVFEVKHGSKFCDFFNSNKEGVLSDVSETFRIVGDLIMKKLPDNGMMGKMKIIRVKSNALGHELYQTLVLARKLGSDDGQYFFEIIRYFDNLSLSNKNKTQPVHRIWQVLQRPECLFVKSKTGERCQCKNYQYEDNTIQCSNPECGHEHTVIQQFSDLDRLPCIVILVEKGRLGDTFPPSLNVMDLRSRHQKRPPFMSSLIQELGRICRYQDKSDVNNLPYALVGPEVIKIFREGHNKSAVFYAAYENKGSKIDAHTRQSKRTKKSSSAAVDSVNDDNLSTVEHGLPKKGNYDAGNEQKHFNRLLFQAEPQIGKTGVFLKTISLLRQIICQVDSNEMATESKEDDFENEELDANDEEDDFHETRDINDEYSDTSASDWQYPFWKTMRINETNTLKTHIEQSKYSRLYGPYRHNQPPEYLICERRKECQTLSNNVYSDLGFGEHKDNALQNFVAYKHTDHQWCTECKTSPPIIHCKIQIDNCDRHWLRLSVPHLQRFEPLLDLLHRRPSDTIKFFSNTPLHQPKLHTRGYSRETERKNRCTLKTWIFNPTYGAAERATINYFHTMVRVKNDIIQPCQYVQILVVRSEEFDGYAGLWQTTHAILQLPPTLPDCDVDVHAGGIGYARRSIQLFSETFNLNRIFVIDDNVYKVHAVEQSSDGDGIDRNENGLLRAETVLLYSVLSHMDGQFVCKRPPKNANDFDPYDFTATAKPCLCGLVPVKENVGLHRFTGGKKQYGVLGVLRLRSGALWARKGFKRAHVYSLVLLNIKALQKRHIYYNPWQVHEDCNLNNDCDQKGLVVCKYNRFLISKRQTGSWMPKLYEVFSGVIVETHKELDAATSVADVILRWIRAIAPPCNVHVLMLNRGQEFSEISRECMSREFERDDSLGQIVMELLTATHGKYHLVCFSLINITSSTTNSENVICKKNTIIANVLGYFGSTPGIGGFKTHVILITTSLCKCLGLISRDDFEREIIEQVFYSPSGKVDFQLLASHNVHTFLVPVLLIHVKALSE